MSTVVACPAQTWKALIEIKTRFGLAKTREQDLIKARDAVKSELDEMDKGQRDKRTAAYLKRAADYYECLTGIDACRRQSKHLADEMSAAIEAGIQGKLFAIDAEDEEFDLPEAPLFDAEKSAAVAANAGAKPAGNANAAPSPWRAMKIEEIKGLSLNQNQVAALRNAGVVKGSDLHKFVMVDKHELRTVDGISGKAATQIYDWLIGRLNSEPAPSPVNADPEEPGEPAAKPTAPAAQAPSTPAAPAKKPKVELKPKVVDPSGKPKKPKGGAA